MLVGRRWVRGREGLGEGESSENIDDIEGTAFKAMH